MNREISTRALIDSLCEGPQDELLTFDLLLDRFRQRTYGLFIILLLLPIFLPLPLGFGGICGPLIALIGVQLMLQFTHPWMPAFIQRRGVSRASLVKFRDRFDKWLGRLERWSRPRWETLIDHPGWRTFSGLLIVLLALLLALPVPLTNYPFGLILMLYAFALIERDGKLMLIAWFFGLLEIVLVGIFSTTFIQAISDLITKLSS
jgi:hypothetical protein